MKKITLSGSWEFKKLNDDKYLPAKVPGCNFTDLLSNKIISDPFYSDNEKQLSWIAKETWVYRKKFNVDSEMLNATMIQLVAKGIDTIAALYINDRKIGDASSVHRTYIFNIKECLKLNDNEIKIIFTSPFNYIEERQKQLRISKTNSVVEGYPHIRKAAYQFGSHISPCLVQCGIIKNIYIRGFDTGRICDTQVTQTHGNGKVVLDVSSRVEVLDSKELILKHTIICPNGEEISYSNEVKNLNINHLFTIKNPEIWWCNGLGEQPLYTLKTELFNYNECVHIKEMKIGLRTISLDTSKDDFGNNFCFEINGVPIFAKGAIWLPPDMFTGRLTRERFRYLLTAMKNANMNMVRVWGGGYYSINIFYDICDELGILVWQDMNFSCSGYPLELKDFQENILNEIKDNVTRLRHHASLCLWYGNDEIESGTTKFGNKKKLVNATSEFFYEVLPNWVKKFDSQTNYWNHKPNNYSFIKKMHKNQFGDTHLWNVWNGMRVQQYYRQRYTRFCSSYGIQSYPSINTIEYIIPEDEQHRNSEILNVHQKFRGGDSRMLYYVEKRFWLAKKFSGFVYLTQLIQMECVRDATEHWRRNRDRCHGAIYSHLNDCWSGATWSSIDFDGNYKALMYGAKKFNENVCVSLEDNKKYIKIYGINDTIKDRSCTVKWQIQAFDGNVIVSGEESIVISKLSAQFIKEIQYNKLFNGKEKKSSALVVWLYDENGKEISQRRSMFYAEKNLLLPKSKLTTTITIENSLATITVTADKYARFVGLDIYTLTAPFSDNYFDLSANESKTVTIAIPENWTQSDVENNFRVISLCDVEAQMSRMQDTIKSTGFILKPSSVSQWFTSLFE